MEDFYEFASGFSLRVSKLNKFDEDENIKYEIPKEIADMLFRSGNEGYEHTLRNFFMKEYRRGFKDGINITLEVVDPQ